VDAITAVQSDCGARSVFQDLVLRTARPGAVIFDFGAGPGIDARFYAERGFTIAAYDVDPSMCEYFSTLCRKFIQTGQIRLDRGSYQDFLRHDAVGDDGGIDLVTSNFAPLNLIGDLPALFEKFDALTGPNGMVLASVLSPYYIGDLKYAWWWRNMGRLWRDGHFSLPGAQGAIIRRRLAEFAAQSSPYFVLERVFRGMPPSLLQKADGVDLVRNGRYAWLHLILCRYMILLFRKGR
jgi:SAM-dependent methyltransferase